MPTIILLDVSLSMCRPFKLQQEEVQEVTPIASTDPTYRDVAVSGIIAFMDHVATNVRVEFTSLMVFSRLWEKVVTFTRDYEQLKAALIGLESFYDKTNVINAINGVNEVVMDEWGSCSPLINVILVTDGRLGLTEIENPDSPSTVKPFPFPCKLDVVLLGSRKDSNISSTISFYEKLIDTNHLNGSIPGVTMTIPGTVKVSSSRDQVHTLDSLTLQSILNLFTRIAESNYHPWKGTLRCGGLFCPITVWPPIEPLTKIADFETIIARPSNEFKIIGFMGIDEIGSPPVVSRHLVLSSPMTREQLLQQPSVFNLSQGEEGASHHLESDIESMLIEDGKQPSLCVLLHGALKVEGMVAVTEIGSNPDWFGILYSWADSKKKSNLMLSTFNPTTDCVPWLGRLRNLGNPIISQRLSQTEIDKYKGKRSYHSQNTIVWIRSSGLQNDIQKIVRLAKRLPDKMSNFYKELSRVRKAAASFGFYEILGGLASILEREVLIIQSSTSSGSPINNDQILHLQYAISVLRSNEAFDIDIPPMR